MYSCLLWFQCLLFSVFNALLSRCAYLGYFTLNNMSAVIDVPSAVCLKNTQEGVKTIYFTFTVTVYSLHFGTAV